MALLNPEDAWKEGAALSAKINAQHKLKKASNEAFLSLGNYRYINFVVVAVVLQHSFLPQIAIRHPVLCKASHNH